MGLAAALGQCWRVEGGRWVKVWVMRGGRGVGVVVAGHVGSGTYGGGNCEMYSLTSVRHKTDNNQISNMQY